MPRYIDADALMENAFEVHTKEFGTILVVGEDAINAQPTAYDPDAVERELKEWSFETEIVIPGSNGYEDTVSRKIICTDNAIGIVRKGGAA